MPQFLVAITFFLAVLSAYITHLKWALALLTSDATASTGQYILSVFGTFMPPIGVIHGVMLWFS